MQTDNSNERHHRIEGIISKSLNHEHKNFHNIQEIGKGSFSSTVYRANWKDSGEYVALKSFKNLDDATEKEIINELELQSKVDLHKNIIRFHGFIKDQENQLTLVMEYADGGTLQNYLRERILTWNEKLNLALQLVDAVSFLHNEEIVHHGLRSSSVLVHQNTIKFSDFGLPKQIKSNDEKLRKRIPYIDPTILKSSSDKRRTFSLNEKSDIYSVGVLLWEISSGQSPFCNEPYDDGLIEKILQGVREKPVPHTPEDYIKIYTDCWKSEPENRPTITRVLNDLKSIIEDFRPHGNRFGRGIEFREGSPIQLLKYNEASESENFGQIVLNPEALNILRTIHEPLAIISVVGSLRRGKSWFANVLHGRHNGFELGAEVDGCTHGIYMWSPPFKLTSKQSDGTTVQKRVIVLDTEGINDPKQDQNWTTKLFILCLTISSTFIYNINGIIGRDDIGKLCLMTDLSKFIQVPDDGNFLPRLVILLRDFTLRTPKSFKDYFLEKLNNVNSKAATAICEYFCDFDVHGLSPPGCKKKMLQHMEIAKTDELDEDFVDEVENAVKTIYSQLPLKYIGPSTMIGTAFVKFLQNIAERMNSSETSTLLSIPSEYESVIQFVSREAINDATGRYKERMDILINEEGKLPMLWEEFDEMHDKCISESNKLFFEKIIGSPVQIRSFVDQLNEKIQDFKEEFIRRNSKELKTYNENIAEIFWVKYVKIGLAPKDSFKNFEELQEALQTFETYCEKSMKKSSEATNVVASYKQNQYQTAINYITQLGGMKVELAKAIHDKEEAERLKLEALSREEDFRMKIEALKREREEYERNVEIKMLELQKNIKQQKVIRRNTTFN